MKNRIWKLLQREKPKCPHYALKTAELATPATIGINLQSVIEKKFVICDEWQKANHPGAPPNPSPWSIIGVFRRSAYDDRVMLTMAPWKENGFVDFGAAINVPADKVGVAAKQ